VSTRRRRFMDVLRRSTELVAGGAPRSTIDDAALTTAHARAVETLREAVSTAEKLAGASSRHRNHIDAVADRQRALATRIGDMRPVVARLAEVQARLSVVALNAGLEGARIEGLAGRALVLVADEVRTLVGRAAASATELGRSLEETALELLRLDGHVTEARSSSGVLGEEASRALASLHQADGALGDIGAHLAQATGLDPELAAAVEKAQAHTRELVTALTVVSSRAGGAVAASALRPIVEPLARLLDQLDGLADEEGG
jgi:methyl-accepting chemotaxis protein